MRAYRRGDPLQLVVWKKAARPWPVAPTRWSAAMPSRSQRHELWLDYAHTGLANPEARLSRLAAWVLQADRLGLHYGLRLPGQEIAQGSGPAQRRRCLEALALC